MGLSLYKKKRDFQKTKEPAGKLQKSKKPIFVVQEHHARRLHYDFRLEGGGVLLSWAVPKGPSMNPDDKRLAVQVEDHPIDYAKFEGDIPKGEYGGGHVEIWDQGTWEPPATWRQDLKRGRLEFILHGTKLSGRWNLVRLKNSKNERQPNWLLMKKHENAAVKLETHLPPPGDFKPQLAQLVEEPPAGPEWIHEIKFDGYRTIARLFMDGKKKSVQLLTRNGLDWTKKYGPKLCGAILELPVHTALLDGEIVWNDEKGRSNFAGLQKALSDSKVDELTYVFFDILFLNGQDLREVPLRERKGALKKVLKAASSRLLAYSEDWKIAGEKVFKEACRRGLEGIISKDERATYLAGRSPEWQKTKCTHRQEVVIGGYTEGPHGQHPLAALLVGTYDNHGDLRYAGRIGTGFTVDMARETLGELKKLNAKQNPFQENPKVPKAFFVRPSLVAEVEFRSWEKDGLIRQGAFKGLRYDKPAQTVGRDQLLSPREQKKLEIEKAIPKGKKTLGQGPRSSRPAPPAPPMAKKLPRVKRAAIGATPEFNFKITHPDRIIFPKDKIKKQDLLTYTWKISDLQMPFIENRPLSLLRCTDTIRKGFFQKHIDAHLYDGVHVQQVTAQERSEEIMTIDSAQGILELVQWGTVEFHAWQMKRDAIASPDQVIFDLDPDAGVSWSDVCGAALQLKQILEGLKLESFVKVTGGKGLHIHVPIDARYGWEKVREFSKSVSDLLAEQDPNLFLTTMSKAKRKNKIFIDYLRNGWGATAILPYSVRARDGAPVAVPVEWSDINKNLNPAQFTLAGADEWITDLKKNNPWEKYFLKPQKIRAFEKKK